MRTPSRFVVAVFLVALVATAGCLSGPLGAGTDTITATDTADETERTNDETERTTGDEHSHTSERSEDGTTEYNDVHIRNADPGDAPDLAASLGEPAVCDAGWVSYWGTNDAGMRWQNDGELRVGWTVPGNQSTLFVAFENDTAVGYDHVEYENSVAADGAAVPVDDDSGTHRYAVVAMLDVNENGEYDPDTDRPCGGGDGELSTTGWIWVDWDADD